MAPCVTSIVPQCIALPRSPRSARTWFIAAMKAEPTENTASIEGSFCNCVSVIVLTRLASPASGSGISASEDEPVKAFREAVRARVNEGNGAYRRGDDERVLRAHGVELRAPSAPWSAGIVADKGERADLVT